MVQRGKSLVTAGGHGNQVAPQVARLEASWAEAYESTVAKLQRLRNAATLWENYDEQLEQVIFFLN